MTSAIFAMIQLANQSVVLRSGLTFMINLTILVFLFVKVTAFWLIEKNEVLCCNELNTKDYFIKILFCFHLMMVYTFSFIILYRILWKQKFVKSIAKKIL